MTGNMIRLNEQNSDWNFYERLRSVGFKNVNETSGLDTLDKALAGFT